MGDLGAPGPKTIRMEDGSRWINFLEEMSHKYNVDIDEILVGCSRIPPSDPTCLVYIYA